MDPGSVIAIIQSLAKTSGVCYQILKRAWKCPKEIKRLNAEVTNWRPQLESMAELLEGDSHSARKLRAKFDDGPLLEIKALVDELNGILEDLEPDQKISLRKRLMWSITTGDKMRDLLDQLHRSMEFVLNTLTFEREIEFDGLRKELMNIPIFETNEHERRNILEWLKPTGIDAHDFHRQKRALREEGTCDWLADSKPWQDWYRGGSEKYARFLWIHGLPGAGKTVLASFGIDHVASEYHHMGVSYYYCSHERHKEGHTSSEEACSFLRWVIRDLTTQVTRPKTRSSNHQAVIPKVLQEMYATNDFSVKSLLECLLDVTAHAAAEFQQQVCILVDAVDESPLPRDELLKVLTTIGTNSEWQHVSLCFTSRKETDITVAIDAIQPARNIRIPIGPSRKLEKRKNAAQSGFDGGSSYKHSMAPPPRRGRVPSGSSSENSLIAQKKSRSVSRQPSGDVSPLQVGRDRERSMSMSPAEESHGGNDCMDIDSPGHADAHAVPDYVKKGCTILSMDDNPDVIMAIRTFVQNQLQDLRAFQRWDKSELDTVIDQLARKAKGMFRWAACQVDIILKSKLCDKDSIIKMLDRIPPDIFGTYEHMIMRLLPDADGSNENNRKFARTALALLCSPSSAVPCAEVLVQASLFKVEGGKAHLFTLQQLEELLGCLITVTSLPRYPETLYSRADEDADCAKQVSVAHYTVKEYLFDEKTALGQAKDFALSTAAIQSLELQVIFSGLQQFGRGRSAKEKYPSRYEEYCLKMSDRALKEQRDMILQDKTVWHAVTDCLRWDSKHHLKEAGAFPNAKVRASFPNWSKTSPFESKNNDNITNHKEHLQPRYSETSVLVSLILLEWPELARAYLADLPEATKRQVWRDKFQLRDSFRVDGTEPRTVMQLCVTRRDVAFLQALIESRADFSGERELVMDVFYHAYGHKSLGDEDGGAKTGQMLKMLLERGVRPETTGYLFTPLQFAVTNLEERWVHDLLYEGADPNATGDADGEDPFSGKDQVHGHLTPLDICQMTKPNRLKSDLDLDQGPMEMAREKVEFTLRQWGAEDKPISVPSDSDSG
ncbi:hypothetical protein diail_3560 [Diaporthe ilicicola]|nr:hypothetical protein diail_3560 [Diaporthe ilicicola]